jgi:hypothetical protein
MGLKRSFKSHYLFLRIVAVVARSSKPLTVAGIAELLDTPAITVAHCIGLNLYFEEKKISELTIPPPQDYWAPGFTEVISCETLSPNRAGRALAVEAAVQKALAEVVEAHWTLAPKALAEVEARRPAHRGRRPLAPGPKAARV